MRVPYPLASCALRSAKALPALVEGGASSVGGPLRLLHLCPAPDSSARGVRSLSARGRLCALLCPRGCSMARWFPPYCDLYHLFRQGHLLPRTRPRPYITIRSGVCLYKGTQQATRVGGRLRALH